MDELTVPGLYYDRWPRLLIAGEPITPDQAEQVLVRTNGYLHCNNLRWQRAAVKIMGLFHALSEMDVSRRGEEGYLRGLWEMEDESYERMGMLRLQYLFNSRIASTYIDGFRGWCNWDGAISYNGCSPNKSPTMQEIDQEWRNIARAFPFLDLRCQVVNERIGSDDLTEGFMWGTWTVRGGKTEFDPAAAELLSIPDGVDDEASIETFHWMLGGNQHITLESLEAIVGRVKKTLPGSVEGRMITGG